MFWAVGRTRNKTFEHVNLGFGNHMILEIGYKRDSDSMLGIS